MVFTFANLRILFGIILAKLGATTFLSFERRPRDRFGNSQQVFQIERRMPAGIKFTIASDADVIWRAPKTFSSIQAQTVISASLRTIPTLSCIVSCKIVLHSIGIFARASLKWAQRFAGDVLDFSRY